MSLIENTQAVVSHAVRVFEGTPKESLARSVMGRLDGPLRVAIAGRVKAGKSTLLNALVGEELAPTDAGECTKVVTWYQNGLTYEIKLRRLDGQVTRAKFSRDGGAIDIDLDGLDPADLDRIVIDWPSSSLRELTLIDTPGIASLSHDISARTHEFLTPGDEQHTEADAVLYLLRHLHASDIGFLEAFHDDDMAQATPINAIGVLSRADEIGVGRLDSMESAARIAQRFRTDPQLRKLCQTVVPVAGLLGQTGASLTEDEYRALTRLAQLPEETRAAMLMSVDRFTSESPEFEVLLPAEREHLLSRLGMFGVRTSIQMILGGEASGAGQLAAALRSLSGIDGLKTVLSNQFARRSDVLKSRTALLAIESLLVDETSPAAVSLAADVEEIQARAHEFAEIRLLNLIRTGATAVRSADVPEAERLLGAEGASANERLGLPEGTQTEDLASALSSAVSKWKRRAENPMASREQVDASMVIVRSCEGLLADLFESSAG